MLMESGVYGPATGSGKAFSEQELYRFQAHTTGLWTALNGTRRWCAPDGCVSEAVADPLGTLKRLKKQIGELVSSHTDGEGMAGGGHLFGGELRWGRETSRSRRKAKIMCFCSSARPSRLGASAAPQPLRAAAKLADIRVTTRCEPFVIGVPLRLVRLGVRTHGAGGQATLCQGVREPAQNQAYVNLCFARKEATTSLKCPCYSVAVPMEKH